MFTYLTDKLRNGLRIVFVPRQSPSVMVSLTVGVGSKHEDKRIRGISHFLEHMAFKGTKKRPDKMAIVKKLDEIGAVYNAGTGKERTRYWIKTTPDYLELMFDIISDITFNPLFPEKEIAVEKGVILEEMNMYEDDPPRKVWDLAENLIFGDNSLGWDTIGTKRTVAGLKRADFVDYQRRFYSPANAVLAVGGGLKKRDWSRVLDLSRKWFGRIRAKPVKEKRVDWCSRPERKLIKKKKTEQTHIIFGVPTFGRGDERRYPLSVIKTALGGNMSSRFWEIIREKRGWAYYVYAVADRYQEAGIFGAKAGLRNDKAQEAVDLLKKEMTSFAKTVDQKEVDEAKGCLEGRFLLSLEPSGSVASFIASQWLLKGEFETVEEVLKKGRAVSLDQVRSLSQELFSPKSFYLAAIGPNERLSL